MRLPAELQNAIDDTAANSDRGALGRAARELSATYQSGEFRTPAVSRPEHRLAYLQTRMPATYAANYHAFAEVRRLMPDLALESMLDLGGGPGTSMWAAVESFPELKSISIVERDYALGELGKQLASGSESDAIRGAKWINDDLAGHRPEVHDLVEISYALGELRPETADKVIANAWRAARKLLVVVEPGTPRNFQRVLKAREQLIATGAQIVAPCPHHNNCPLAAVGDWCHFAERVERTAEHRRLKAGELGYEDEKFSYVAASRIATEWPRARIVRHPLFRPGHVKLTLCTAEGLKQETVGKSQKDNYRAARKSAWGDSWA
jgi:ribosomal protein RSM22 (predicted rRNA methylase)